MTYLTKLSNNVSTQNKLFPEHFHLIDQLRPKRLIRSTRQEKPKLRTAPTNRSSSPKNPKPPTSKRQTRKPIQKLSHPELRRSLDHRIYILAQYYTVREDAAAGVTRRGTKEPKERGFAATPPPFPPSWPRGVVGGGHCCCCGGRQWPWKVRIAAIGRPN